MPTVHLLVKGKVQGVFFRATAKEKALSLKLIGWVKNTPNGDVEITASGSEDNLQAFIHWCRKGPVNALVKAVLVTRSEEGKFEGFQIIY